MSEFLKIYHPDEDMSYVLDRVVCKTVWQDKLNCLFVEIESNEEIDHIEEDAIQNRFPKVILTLEDFPIEYSSLSELNGVTLDIPESSVQKENKDGEIEEVVYTNLCINDDDFETINNKIAFELFNGLHYLRWKGRCLDFVKETDSYLDFEFFVPIE